MSSPNQPEIIPPGGTPEAAEAEASAGAGIRDEHLNMLATVLDDLFVIPGTDIRFGLDALIGLLPGLGDLVTGVASFLIVYAAWERGLPRVTVVRMVANISIDTLVGTIPIAGDAFDVVWRSNRMNYNLLVRARQPGGEPAPGKTQRLRHTVTDWLFLLGLAATALALLALPFVVLAALVRFFLPHGR